MIFQDMNETDSRTNFTQLSIIFTHKLNGIMLTYYENLLGVNCLARQFYPKLPRQFTPRVVPLLLFHLKKKLQ